MLSLLLRAIDPFILNICIKTLLPTFSNQKKNSFATELSTFGTYISLHIIQLATEGMCYTYLVIKRTFSYYLPFFKLFVSTEIEVRRKGSFYDARLLDMCNLKTLNLWLRFQKNGNFPLIP